jgi:hypothetical protein
MLPPDDHSRFLRPDDAKKRFAIPSNPSSFVDDEHRHSHGYAHSISPASIGRVRFAAMTSEIRAHLMAQSSKQFGAGATVTESNGALCVRLNDEIVYVVVQDMASAIHAIQGSIDLLLHCSEDARDKSPAVRVVLMVVGIGTGGREVETYIADLTTRYQSTFRYVTYKLGRGHSNGDHIQDGRPNHVSYSDSAQRC